MGLLVIIGVAQVPPKLEILESLPTQELAHGIPEPIKCDADGNIYFQTASVLPMGAPLVRISSDGSTVTHFEFAKGEYSRSEITDFAVGTDGILYGVMRNRGRSYLVEFEKGGQVKALTEVVSPYGQFVVRNLSAFSPDVFLASGTMWGQDKHVREFTGIMGGDGQIKREIFLKGDVDQKKEKPDTPLFGPSWVGDDGYAYLMRTPGSGALFFVISAAGEVVRTVSVSSPVDGSSAATFGLSRGRLAVYFYKSQGDGPGMVWLKVVNSRTGEEIATYTTPDDLKGIFVCYNSGTFEFLVARENRKFDLVRAGAR